MYARFLADDFASNDLFYDKGDRVGNQKLMQQQAENAGNAYEWEMPPSAFEPSTGRRENSRYEVWNESAIMIRFKDWVVANPENANPSVAA